MHMHSFALTCIIYILATFRLILTEKIYLRMDATQSAAKSSIP